MQYSVKFVKNFIIKQCKNSTHKILILSRIEKMVRVVFFFAWLGWILKNHTLKAHCCRKRKKLICGTEGEIVVAHGRLPSLARTTVCSQNMSKQTVNIADETLTDYSFLSRYHYTKSKNYLKRRYQIRHWIPMFIGTPCI